MTDKKNFRRAVGTKKICELLLLITVTLALILSKRLTEGAREGLVLSLGTVIPAVFPFMVLGEAISTLIDGERIPLSRPLSKIIGIPPYLLPVFISGTVSGFPVGAAMARKAIAGGADEEEAVICAALASNPSPAFVLGAVGALAGGGKYGAILLVSLLLSVILTANIFRKKTRKNAHFVNTSCQKYNFIASVRRAGTTSITVFAFITFFSSIGNVISVFLKNEEIFAVAISLLEVSSAAKFLLSDLSAGETIRACFLGFAIGFGGLCANLQALAELETGEKLRRKFLLIKLTLGAVSALITPSLLFLFEAI